MITLIENGRVVSPGMDLPVGFIRLEDEMIREVSDSPIPVHADRVIDAANRIVMPGFIDIHCHGRSGYDFCDGSFESVRRIAEGKREEGVTSFLATTMTVSPDSLKDACRSAAEYRDSESDGAELLGMHLEGPFFAAECVGAQNPAFLRAPDIHLVDEWNRLCRIVKVSFSPELPGSETFIQELVERGIMPSGGHSSADYECFLRSRTLGLKHLTHFCNVMTPVHHLRFGMVGGGLMSDDVFVEIICDGVHLSDPMIAMISRLKGPDRVMLITDAICASAMPDGRYSLGGLPVFIKNGRTSLANGTVAGSTLQYFNGFRKYVEVTGLPLSEAVKASSWNQASSLGIPGRGRIEEGFFADLVLTDQQLFPKMTICKGRSSTQ